MSEPQEFNREEKIREVLQYYNDVISNEATEFVKHLGETLFGWKGVQVSVIYDPNRRDLMVLHGGPTVVAWINIDNNDKDFKKILYDIARAANKNWNPVEVARSHRVVHKKGDKSKARKGEPAWLIPMKFCQLNVYRSVTLKGPDGVSVTVEDNSGRKMESELIYEARCKLSTLLDWDNKEDDEDG